MTAENVMVVHPPKSVPPRVIAPWGRNILNDWPYWIGVREEGPGLSGRRAVPPHCMSAARPAGCIVRLTLDQNRTCRRNPYNCHVVRTSPEKDMPSMLTVAETGSLSVPLVSNHDVASPLRYPGGKSVLSGYVASLIDVLGIRNVTYVEPYAGGAGVALRLLKDRKVSKAVINDYDPDVFAFWNSAVNDSASFLERFDRAEPTIEEWHRQKRIIADPASELDRGFAFFFLNRTNRSGVLNGGVIGGLKQNGRYKVSARYNKASLRRKLEFLGEHVDSIEVRNEDGRAVVERFVGFPEAFIYADPPYVEKGGSLYMNALDDERHRELGNLLNNHADSHWMLTYDDTALIRELYGERYGGLFPLQYSASARRTANELMIFSDTLGKAAAHMH